MLKFPAVESTREESQNARLMRNLIITSLIMIILVITATACSPDSDSDADSDGLTASQQPSEISPAGTPTASATTEGPRISFDQEYLHLGQATPDQRIDCTFTFENVGDAPLLIHEVKRKTLEGC